MPTQFPRKNSNRVSIKSIKYIDILRIKLYITLYRRPKEMDNYLKYYNQEQ